MPQIVDIQLKAFGRVIQERLNGDKELAQDFVDTYGQNLLPCADVVVMSPGSMSLVFGGNARYPVLAMWRVTNEYSSFTNHERRCTAQVGFKYILPADFSPEHTFATLNLIAFKIDQIQYYGQEYPLGGDIMAAAGIHSWGYRWKIDFGYEGPNEQTLYPTASGVMSMDADVHFDRSVLVDLLGLDINYNLRGAGSDGAAAPTIDPLVQQRLPQPPPLWPQPPPPKP